MLDPCGKTRCVVLDHGDNCETLALSDQTSPPELPHSAESAPTSTMSSGFQVSTLGKNGMQCCCRSSTTRRPDVAKTSTPLVSTQKSAVRANRRQQRVSSFAGSRQQEWPRLLSQLATLERKHSCQPTQKSTSVSRPSGAGRRVLQHLLSQERDNTPSTCATRTSWKLPRWRLTMQSALRASALSAPSDIPCYVAVSCNAMRPSTAASRPGSPGGERATTSAGGMW